MPLRLLPYAAGNDPLLLLVGVGGNEGAGLPPLRVDAPEAEVLERVGGFWRTGLHAESRLAKVQAALAGGQRVFMIGFRAKRVVRAVEVRVGVRRAHAPRSRIGRGTASNLTTPKLSNNPRSRP